MIASLTAEWPLQRRLVAGRFCLRQDSGTAGERQPWPCHTRACLRREGGKCWRTGGLLVKRGAHTKLPKESLQLASNLVVIKHSYTRSDLCCNDILADIFADGSTCSFKKIEVRVYQMNSMADQHRDNWEVIPGMEFQVGSFYCHYFRTLMLMMLAFGGFVVHVDSTFFKISSWDA